MTTDDSNNGTNGGSTLEDIAQGRSPADVARLIRNRKRSGPGVEWDPTQAEEELQQIADAVGPEPDDSLPLDYEDVHIVKILIPAEGEDHKPIEYYTLAVGGVAQVTRRPDGTIDTSNIMSHKDDLLRILVESGMTSDYIVKRAKRSKPKGNPNPTGRNPGQRRLAFDPNLRAYLKETGREHVSEVLENAGGNEKRKVIKDPKKLETILDPNFVGKARGRGWDVSVQSVGNFVSSSRREIRKYRNIYVGDYFDSPEITVMVSAFAREGSGYMDALLESDASDLSDVGKDIYFWAQDHDERREDVPVNHIVDAIRYNFLKDLAQADPDYERIRDVTAKWLSFAISADVVVESEFVQKEVIPQFGSEFPNYIPEQVTLEDGDAAGEVLEKKISIIFADPFKDPLRDDDVVIDALEDPRLAAVAKILIDAGRYGLEKPEFKEAVDAATGEDIGYKRLKVIVETLDERFKDTDFTAREFGAHPYRYAIIRRRSNTDINFDVARRLGEIIVSRDNKHGTKYFKQIVRGLWMFGYFRGNLATKEGTMERKATGVDTEYNDIMSHVNQRNNMYTPLLMDSLDRQLESGDIKPEDVSLEQKRDYEALGRKLFDGIKPATRDKYFTHLHTGAQHVLAEHGTRVTRVLTLWTGIYRDDILKTVHGDR